MPPTDLTCRERRRTIYDCESPSVAALPPAFFFASFTLLRWSCDIFLHAPLIHITSRQPSSAAESPLASACHFTFFFSLFCMAQPWWVERLKSKSIIIPAALHQHRLL